MALAAKGERAPLISIAVCQVNANSVHYLSTFGSEGCAHTSGLLVRTLRDVATRTIDPRNIDRQKAHVM